MREAVAGADVAVTRRKRLRLTTSVGVTEHSAGEDMEHLLSRVTEGPWRKPDSRAIIASSPSNR